MANKVGRPSLPEGEVLVRGTVRFTIAQWQWIKQNLDKLRKFVDSQIK